jgi:peptide/nickel transport system substrate-binding protein
MAVDTMEVAKVHRLRGRGMILGFVLVALIAAACGGGGKSSTATTTPASVKQGGDIVVSAEQEPDCTDWIASCASAAWGSYTLGASSLPRAYDYSNAKGYTPSVLLTGEATLVTSPKQMVTYHINPKAVWDDGQPIISTDFKYVWQQVTTSKDVFSTTGYQNIESVDDSDPHTAVVTYKTPYADWKSLWSDTYGAEPSHLLQGKDRSALMKDGYTWSGGPWKLDHWTKTVELKIVPNPNYFGKKPNLSSVTWKFITDTAAEQADFKSGQVLAAYPQAQPGQEALKGTPGTFFDAQSGLSYEGIWFNVEKAPVNSKAVRQALAYATDRNAIVAQLFAPIQPDIKPIQSFFTPAYGKVYTTPFSKYSLDLAMVNTLMTGDGWAKGADGIWAKGGQKANLEVKTTTGNKRRQLTVQILQNQWKTAGFGLSITQEKAGILFGKDLPAGNFQTALFAQTPTDNDPGQCVIWCSANIPTQANGGTGGNYDRISDPNMDKLWSDADSNLDVPARIKDAQDATAILADMVPAIPLDPFPDILVVNSDRLGAQGGFQHNFSINGMYVFLNTWYQK